MGSVPCFRVLDRMLCVARVELIILKVSRYVTRSVSRCVRWARLDLRLVCVFMWLCRVYGN